MSCWDRDGHHLPCSRRSPFPGSRVRPLAGASAQGHGAKVHRGSLGRGEERVLGTAAQAGLLHGINGVPQKLVCVLLVPEAEMPGDL